MAADAEAAYIQLQSRSELFTMDDVKEQILKNKKRVPEPKAISFLAFLEIYIERSVALKSHTTIKAYKNTRNHLLDFEKTMWPKKLSFESIDQLFYDDFMQFLIQKKQLSNNTIGNQIKNLKVFLNEATELGINKTFEYKKKKFKKLQEESDSIYLTEDEIKDLYNLNLDDKPSLQRVRDLFIIGCWTGLRFSDFTKLRKENISKGMISIRTQKTDQALMIPIHPMVLKIFKKYTVNDEIILPRAITNQKMNNYLKVVGQKAELDQKIIVTTNRGISREKKPYHKHELVTTHTARRSFATNLYLQGFPAISIMKITGHKSEQSFLKYIKVSQEENARKLMEFWKSNKKVI
ncbi:MAG: site-specific integrase [Bacteroidota bacterium]